MDLNETNHQINITFEHFVSSYASFKKRLNAKGFKMLWECCSSCAKNAAAASVSVARVMWECKGDVNSALGGNSKEPWLPATSAEASFDDDSDEEALNVNKVFSAIIEKNGV